MFKLALAACLTLAGATAHAAELQPIEAAAIVLNEVKGIAYYTVEPAGFRVVATVATSEGGKPVRMTAVLTDGQKLVFSVPGSVSSEPVEMEIARKGDTLTITDAPVLVAAN